ncbi:hypothetical protein M9435_005832 [Picochlorum sp. BPE23]|nr:hypothetical protein M9435_005832 [Picochlorum sp. BPE23]
MGSTMMEIDTAPSGGAEEFPQSSSGLEFHIHPRVLFRIGDHYTRVKVAAQLNLTEAQAKSPNTKNTVHAAIGCLLGEQHGRTVDVQSSFEMQLDESGAKGIDMDLLNNRIELYREVHPGADVLGWYRTGSEVSEQDMNIHGTFLRLNASSAFLLYNPSVSGKENEEDVLSSLALYESQDHEVYGCKSTVFTVSKFDIVSSEMERIVVNQFSNLEASHRKARSSSMMKSHQVALHSSVQALIERVTHLQHILISMKQGKIPYDPEMAQSIAAFADRLPQLHRTMRGISDSRSEEQKISLLTAALAATMAGAVSLERHSKFDLLQAAKSRPI